MSDKTTKKLNQADLSITLPVNEGVSKDYRRHIEGSKKIIRAKRSTWHYE